MSQQTEWQKPPGGCLGKVWVGEFKVVKAVGSRNGRSLMQTPQPDHLRPNRFACIPETLNPRPNRFPTAGHEGALAHPAACPCLTLLPVPWLRAEGGILHLAVPAPPHWQRVGWALSEFGTQHAAQYRQFVCANRICTIYATLWPGLSLKNSVGTSCARTKKDCLCYLSATSAAASRSRLLHAAALELYSRKAHVHAQCML